MRNEKYITIISNRKKFSIDVSTILYVIIKSRNAEIHVSEGIIYKTRKSLDELEAELGDDFIKVHRSCIVSARAIHDVTNKINIINGDTLKYTIRKKKKIIAQIHSIQKSIINSFDGEGIPRTEEEYRRYYSIFDNLPFAFTDIEMIFDEEKHAVDWIFRYGNPALAKIEKMPLEQLIGSSFSSLFANMDSKWLRSYERTALYGEVLEIFRYSPEVDTYLNIICFPTFNGHCGCMLFDVSGTDFKNIGDKEIMLNLCSRMITDRNK